VYPSGFAVARCDAATFDGAVSRWPTPDALTRNARIVSAGRRNGRLVHSKAERVGHAGIVPAGNVACWTSVMETVRVLMTVDGSSGGSQLREDSICWQWVRDPCSLCSISQSVTGEAKWSSNSSVQIECVIFSML
jgi:hypothetical protein